MFWVMEIVLLRNNGAMNILIVYFCECMDEFIFAGYIPRSEIATS